MRTVMHGRSTFSQTLLHYPRLLLPQFRLSSVSHLWRWCTDRVDFFRNVFVPYYNQAIWLGCEITALCIHSFIHIRLKRIEYKLLSLTYKVLTTAQPSYLRNIISLQPPRSTRSSSVVTLYRPPTISLNITDRSFRYASPRLWNQLPDSFRQPHHSRLDSPPHPLLNSSLSSSTLSSSITPSLFHSGLKTYLFNKFFPP